MISIRLLRYGSARLPSTAMTVSAFVLLTIPAAFAAGGVSPSTETRASRDPFLEQGGYVVMEAESVDLVSDWGIVAPPPGDPTMAGALGNLYLEWTGSQFFGNTQPPGGVVGILDYRFVIETEGVYQFRWRSKQYSDVGSFDAGNDSYLRFATGEAVDGFFDFSQFHKSWVQSKATWSWTTTLEPIHGQHHVNRAARYYTPGLHTIQIAARSPGHAIDRMVLFHEMHSFDLALFESLPESPTTGQGEGQLLLDGFESGNLDLWDETVIE